MLATTQKRQNTLTRQSFFWTVLLILTTVTVFGQTGPWAKALDTTYTTVDKKSGTTKVEHVIRSTGGGSSVITTEYFDNYNSDFKFLSKKVIRKQHECTLDYGLEEATIYDTSGTYRTFSKEYTSLKDEGKNAIVKYYDKSGKLIKKEKIKYTEEFYKSIQYYFRPRTKPKKKK